MVTSSSKVHVRLGFARPTKKKLQRISGPCIPMGKNWDRWHHVLRFFLEIPVFVTLEAVELTSTHLEEQKCWWSFLLFLKFWQLSSFYIRVRQSKDSLHPAIGRGRTWGKVFHTQYSVKSLYCCSAANNNSHQFFYCFNKHFLLF